MPMSYYCNYHHHSKSILKLQVLTLKADLVVAVWI